MKAHCLFLIAWTMLLSVPTQAAATGALSDTATVHIRIVDAMSGIDLGVANVESFAPRLGMSAMDLADNFVGNKASKVPYGIYRLKVRRPGFWSAEREVFVFQPETYVVVGLVIGMEWEPPATGNLCGKLVNLGATASELYVRLMSVFGTWSIDSKADELGNFTLAGLPPGSYVFVVREGAQILDVRSIQIPASAPLVVVLPDRQSPNRSD